MFETTTKSNVELLTCVPLDRHGVPHGFTSRRHGFGDRKNGKGDHAALARALELDATAAMKQVHGCDVRVLGDGDRSESAPECDGIVSDRRGLGLIVHTADCVPVLMWAEHANVVSAVHAGWRGTLANVVAAAVATLVDEHGVSPDEIHVALGPSIRVCCFEVGDEVVGDFVRGGRRRDVISRPGPRGRRHVDLIEDNRRQLVDAGVRSERIYDSGRCTACENERFYSYRKEGSGVGRLMGVIAVRS